MGMRIIKYHSPKTQIEQQLLQLQILWITGVLWCRVSEKAIFRGVFDISSFGRVDIILAIPSQ